jgi:hypothetical protein
MPLVSRVSPSLRDFEQEDAAFQGGGTNKLFYNRIVKNFFTTVWFKIEASHVGMQRSRRDYHLACSVEVFTNFFCEPTILFLNQE